MDFGTLGGIVLGIICILVSIIFSDALGAIKVGGAIGAFIDVGSIMIVLGGGFASALVSFRLNEIAKIISVTVKVFLSKNDSPIDNLRLIIKLAQKARRDGLLSLEEDQESIKDPFLKKALEFVVDGYDPELTKDILVLDIENMMERHEKGKKLYDFLGKTFPGWGMIGTLIGLVMLLGQLDDPSKIGPAMAVALITTFYGSVLANFICAPIANKLTQKSEEEANAKRMILEGILSIQTGEQPAVIENKLKTFLSPAQKRLYEQPDAAKQKEQEEEAPAA